jgi:pilus assembly protein CpaF
VEARINILVAGGTSSGKTTVARLIAELTPPEERLIAVERAYGMQIDHPRVVPLEAGGPAGLSFEEVLTAATRMRPDRLVVSEVDGPIAAPMLQHFSSGYDGSIANMHATSAQDALNRLESFCLMANLGLGLTEIRQLIASGIQLVTVQERLSDGTRKIVEVVELRGLQDHRYILHPLMRFNRESYQCEFPDANPSWEQ